MLWHGKNPFRPKSRLKDRRARKQTISKTAKTRPTYWRLLLKSAQQTNKQTNEHGRKVGISLRLGQHYRKEITNRPMNFPQDLKSLRRPLQSIISLIKTYKNGPNCQKFKHISEANLPTLVGSQSKFAPRFI